MPKVTGPMFSLRASGTFARTLTYEDGGATQRVRRLPAYVPARTPLQQIYVEKVRALADAWRHLNESTKNDWRTRAIDFSTQGYTLWWKEWIQQGIEPPNIPTIP